MSAPMISRVQPKVRAVVPPKPFRFVLVRGVERIREIGADDLREAVSILRPDADRGEYVASKENLAIGMAKPLPDGQCTACGRGPKKEGYDRCAVCINARRRLMIQELGTRAAEARDRAVVSMNKARRQKRGGGR